MPRSKPGTRVASGAEVSARRINVPTLLAVLGLSGALAAGAVAYAGSASADQVSSLTARAKTISQELVQEQLQAGAYQQQYSVVSAQVADDQRAIASTQRAIASDRKQIDTRLHLVRRLAIASYVLNGAGTSSSGASLFAQNLSTVQSANEYAEISVGNLNQALDQLHTAQRAEQSQQQTLARQSALDRAEQTRQASSLANANATVSQLASVQAQVTGQLAQAVAQQNAALARSAAAAVAAAQRTTERRTDGTASAPVAAVSPIPGAPAGASSTIDPTLPPFLQCVVQAESGGDYQAVSPNGLYMGAFQFSQPTWNFAAREAGRPDLVGVPPNETSKADQDTLAVTLYSLDGEQPWLGDRCSA